MTGIDRDKYPRGTFKPTEPLVRAFPKVGRNDKCPCGSGVKAKKCCMNWKGEKQSNE